MISKLTCLVEEFLLMLVLALALDGIASHNGLLRGIGTRRILFVKLPSRAGMIKMGICLHIELLWIRACKILIGQA